jgi:dihydrofolate reductase
MNFVISRTPQDANTDNPFGPFWCSSLEESVERSKQYNNTYIIGGEQIYKLALEKNIVEKIILSRINTHYEGNKYFHVPDGWNIKDKVKYKEFDVLYLEK